MLNLHQLNHVDEATKNTKLYQWAKLFKASTWEEVIELSKNDETIEEAIVTLKTLTAEEEILLQCEAREKYNWDLSSATAKGLREGEVIGIEKGKKQLATLTRILLKDKRYTDLDKATSDDNYYQQLLKKYNII